jgi:hypothetical protein
MKLQLKDGRTVYAGRMRHNILPDYIYNSDDEATVLMDTGAPEYFEALFRFSWDKCNDHLFFQFTDGNWYWIKDDELWKSVAKLSRSDVGQLIKVVKSHKLVKRTRPKLSRKHRLMTTQFAYSDGGRGQSLVGANETRDCTVRAMAHLLDLSYDAAHSLMKSFGRQPRHGAHIPNMTSNMKPVAFLNEQKFERVPLLAKKKTSGTFVSEHPQGTFLINVRSHVFVIKNGKVLDTFYRPGSRIITAYRKVED